MPVVAAVSVSSTCAVPVIVGAPVAGGVGRHRRDHRRRGRAGAHLGIAGVVGEAHLHLDRLALVGGDQGVGARRRPGDVGLGAVGLHPDPLVGVADAGHPVGVHDAGGDCRQRLAHLRRARDRRRPRRGTVGAAVHLVTGPAAPHAVRQRGRNLRRLADDALARVQHDRPAARRPGHRHVVEDVDAVVVLVRRHHGVGEHQRGVRAGGRVVPGVDLPPVA